MPSAEAIAFAPVSPVTRTKYAFVPSIGRFSPVTPILCGASYVATLALESVVLPSDDAAPVDTVTDRTLTAGMVAGRPECGLPPRSPPTRRITLVIVPLFGSHGIGSHNSPALVTSLWTQFAPFVV